MFSILRILENNHYYLCQRGYVISLLSEVFWFVSKITRKVTGGVVEIVKKFKGDSFCW